MLKDDTTRDVELEEQIDTDDQADDVEEVSDDTDDTDDNAGDASDEGDDQDQSDDGIDYQAKLNVTNRFLKKEGYEFKDGKWVKGEKPATPAKKDVKKDEGATDDATLSRLEVRGVMEPEDQQYVLKYAKSEGISPLDALSHEIVKDRLAANDRKRKSDQATPRANNRTATQQDEVEAWVRKYKKTGELPEDNPALTAKILDKLKEGA